MHMHGTLTIDCDITLLIGWLNDAVVVRMSFLGGRRKLTEVQAAVGRDMRPFETSRIW